MKKTCKNIAGQLTLAIAVGSASRRYYLELQPRRNIAPLRVACLPARHPARKVVAYLTSASTYAREKPREFHISLLY
jgi:hypothetical protein